MGRQLAQRSAQTRRLVVTPHTLVTCTRAGCHPARTTVPLPFRRCRGSQPNATPASKHCLVTHQPAGSSKPRSASRYLRRSSLIAISMRVNSVPPRSNAKYSGPICRGRGCSACAAQLHASAAGQAAPHLGLMRHWNNVGTLAPFAGSAGFRNDPEGFPL